MKAYCIGAFEFGKFLAIPVEPNDESLLQIAYECNLLNWFQKIFDSESELVNGPLILDSVLKEDPKLEQILKDYMPEEEQIIKPVNVNVVKRRKEDANAMDSGSEKEEEDSDEGF